MTTLPKVKVLATGGTIAGSSSCTTAMTGYQAGALGIDVLLHAVPEIAAIADVSGEQISEIDSCNMTEDIWFKLADKINAILADATISGIVITHGTDTMEETAYFLNLVLNSDKPVILVGAMRPATAISADGPLNLLNAVKIAIHPDAVGKGVLVTMNDEIHSARDVTKTNTFMVNTFKATELGILGYIINGAVKFYRATTRKHTSQVNLHLKNITALPQVEIIYAHASQSRILIDAAVNSGAKGIIYAGMGNGSIHCNAEAALIDAAKQGIAVVRSSRAGNGVVVTTNPFWDQNKFIKSDTLNPQKSRILLALALTQTNDPEEIQQMFNEY